ncbi:EF-hand-like domain protein [Ascosphaera apis ARSEF 7405]|uniref:EF-hand-like domain protein n=1 Tax=Ascosphaera apis ARSEF 7405 TaxID=392613 RepID=A0A166NRZ9_9EURO|nr:EF-hand-like domain protein [Ascosphaera apis ARSEF 7405]
MTPNKDEDHATALKGATLAFKGQPQLTPESNNSTHGPDDGFARIAALREFDTKQRQVGHQHVASDAGDRDCDLDAKSKHRRRRSQSPDESQAGIVGDRIKQFSLRAADRAVDRQQQRSVSLQRPSSVTDSQYIAAKLAAEHERPSRSTSVDAAARRNITRNGAVVIPKGSESQLSNASQRQTVSQGTSTASINGPTPQDGRQSLSSGHNGANGHIELVRTSHIPPMESSNSLATMFDRQGSSTSRKERPKPPVKPRNISTHSEQLPPKLPVRPNAERRPSSVRTRSTDRLTRRPRSLHRRISEGPSSSTSRRDSLQDAVAASNLAVTRARELPPKPPPPRRTGTKAQKSSPERPAFKQTLRKEQPYDIDELERQKRYRKHRHIFNKHPHKHHEGDRKHWRDTITERERKRYEGVWAANRGLWIVFDNEGKSISPPKLIMDALPERALPENMVLNAVVKDIWSRSRLSQDILAAIWDLVSHTALGMLSREEFVVGMWLIDQCLKGRKLPMKVSQSVWASTQSLSGINIKLDRC